MLDPRAVHEHIVASGALLEGHFLLSSGLHSPNYVQCALALREPRKAEKLGAGLAALWQGPAPAAVVSPALGGLIIGYETARALGVPFMFAERENGEMALRRGFRLEPGAGVVIVEDVFTTGKSTIEAAAAVKAAGGAVLGALSIIDRMSARALPFSYASLLRLGLTVYEPSDCPLCKKGRELVKPGSRVH